MNGTARGWAVAALVTASLGAAGLVRAQETRTTFDFEDGPQGFVSLRVKGAEVGPDPDSPLTVPKDRNLARQGEGHLAFKHRIEVGTLRIVGAEVRLPAATRSLRVSLRCDQRTAVLVSLREEDGSTYQAQFHLPNHQWTEVEINLDELVMDEGGTDENGKLDADQVRFLGFMDMANMLAGLGDPNSLIPGYAPERTLQIDDLRLAATEAPRSRGEVKTPQGTFVVVDNFEGQGARWLPIRVLFAQPPTFQIFPESKLELVKEAAGPGMARTAVEPGGKGLRFSYNREKQMAFALNTNCQGLKLEKADRLLISTNVNRPSLLIVQVKEKDDSEYNYTILPDGSVGWTNRVLDFTGFALADNSKDENNQLDGAQIKEITILDASAFLGDQIAGGDVTLEVDAVAFGLKP